MRSVVLSVLLGIGVYGADIINLVTLLDRNETESFIAQVKSVDEANAMRPDNNKTILMYACWIGNEQAVRHLILKGSDVNVQDAGGATALHLAAWKGHTTIGVYLLQNGASTALLSKEGMSALDIALMKNNTDLATAIEKSAPKLKSLLGQ